MNDYRTNAKQEIHLIVGNAMDEVVDICIYERKRLNTGGTSVVAEFIPEIYWC